MGSPLEYIQDTEAELRTARSRIARLERELAEARADLAIADNLRAGIVTGAVDAAENMAVACDRLALWEPVVEAAVSYAASDGRGSDHRDLCTAVENLERLLDAKASS